MSVVDGQKGADQCSQPNRDAVRFPFLRFSVSSGGGRVSHSIHILVSAEDASCQKSALADLHAGKSQDKSVLAVELKHCRVYVSIPDVP